MAFDWSSLIPSAAPIQDADLDPDKVRASGDPMGMIAAAKAGVPYQAKPGQMGRTLTADGPQPQSSPIGGVQRTGVSSPPNGGVVMTNDAPGDPSGPQAVPSTVTPSGSQSKFSDVARQMLSQKQQALQGAQSIPNAPDVGGLEAQRVATVAKAPNPNDPNYKPTLKSRFLRGLEGVGLGLAEGGLRGAIAGGIAPQTTGLAGYRDPNSAFSRDKSANDTAVSGLDQQIKAAQDQQKDVNERVKNATEIANSEGTGVTQATAADKQQNPAPKGIDEQTYDSLLKQGMTPQAAYQQMQKDKGEPGREQSESLRRDQMAQTEELRRDQMRQSAQFHQDTEADREESRKQREADKEQQRNKPTADEQKKADLVDNLNENLGVVEEIARRRPELFGPVAGRWTELKNKIGTSDPDIAALETAQHQLGMVQQGVHGMRSAQGLQGSVDSLMNGFHNSPGAIMQSIKTARDSAKTFSQDVGQKGQPGHGGIPGARSSDSDNAAPPSGKEVSLADARSLPAMKGKTDDQIRKAIVASGHRVKE